MKFCENNDSIITLPKYQNCFVYFLLLKQEVVYVGQTKHGLIRPLTHAKNKDFDEIKILYTNEKDLDFIEDLYIKKYTPTYNRQNNYAITYSLHRVRDCVRKQIGLTKYNIPQLRKVIKTLGIHIDIDYYTNKEFVTFDDYCKIMKYLNGQTNERTK